MTTNTMIAPFVDQYKAHLDRIATLTQQLDPVSFGKTKAINSLIDETPAVGAVVDQIKTHLADKGDSYITALVTVLRRELRAYDEIVNRWVGANVDTSENAPKLSSEEEDAVRKELDQIIDIAKVTRQFLTMNAPELDSVLAAVPTKRRGAKRGSSGKRLRGKFVWVVRTLDNAGAIIEEEQVEGHTLTAVGSHTKVGAAAVRAAMTAAGYSEEDIVNPPSKFVFTLSGKKGENFQVVGNKVETDDNDDDDDDEPEADPSEF